MSGTSHTLVRAIVAALAADPAALEELRGLLTSAEADRMLTTHEAAARLGVHPTTLTKAALAGRVRGAQKIGSRNWRYRQADLELLPPAPADHDDPGLGVGRRTGRSSAAAAIRGTTGSGA
jgi:hypothetical protein